MIVYFLYENILTNLRFEILDKLRFFVICESKYDIKETLRKLIFHF